MPRDWDEVESYRDSIKESLREDLVGLERLRKLTAELDTKKYGELVKYINLSISGDSIRYEDELRRL